MFCISVFVCVWCQTASAAEAAFRFFALKLFFISLLGVRIETFFFSDMEIWPKFVFYHTEEFSVGFVYPVPYLRTGTLYADFLPVLRYGKITFRRPSKLYHHLSVILNSQLVIYRDGPDPPTLVFNMLSWLNQNQNKEVMKTWWTGIRYRDADNTNLFVHSWVKVAVRIKTETKRWICTACHELKLVVILVASDARILQDLVPCQHPQFPQTGQDGYKGENC
jgi:hypothetical protein